MFKSKSEIRCRKIKVRVQIACIKADELIFFFFLPFLIHFVHDFSKEMYFLVGWDK